MASGEGKLWPVIPEIDHARVDGSRSIRVPRKRHALLVAPIVVVAILMISVAAIMVPGDPIGSEFQVNTYTSDSQISPSVALNTSGNSVVVWSSWRPDWGGYCVYLQLLDSSGQKVGNEFPVYNWSSDDQINPAVAMHADGNFTVVYQTTREYQPSSGTYNSGIRQMFYNSMGQLTAVINVPAGDDPDEYDPAVAVRSEWSVWTATVWTEAETDGSGEGIFGWICPGLWNHSINTWTAGDQASPSVAMNSDGESIVVWSSDGQDGDSGGIYGQRFLNDSNASGSEFIVNTYVAGNQAQPSVAVDSSGNFVVVWSSYGQDGDGWGIFGQRFSSDGMKLGSEFRVNSYASGSQHQPSVAMSSEGEFVVVWSSIGQDGSGSAVVGQRFCSDGTALGSEFVINSYQTGDQSLPCVSMNGIGDFAVVWQSDGQDGSGWGIYGQLYNRAPIPEFPSSVIPVAITAALLVALRKTRRS